MKIRFVVALVGFAISFALPTFAQQKDTVDPKIGQQIRVLAKKYDEALNKHDAAAIAALYTQDGVRMTPDGTFHGRQAIEKGYAYWEFDTWHQSDFSTKVYRVIAVGNEVRSVGACSWAYKSEQGVPHHCDGHYSAVLVREGDTWKIRKYSCERGC